jgi:C-methyltransferase C-terminal domain
VEFHHVLELIVEGQFDVISHSHCCYLSLLTLQQVFERRGLTLVDAERLPVHGGSVRAYARRSSEGPVAGPGVERVLQAEHAAGLDQATTYEGFTERVTEVQRLLIEGLRAWRQEGLRVAHGGTVTVAPSALGGTRVEVTLPRLAATGGGTVTETEAGDDGAAYGVEVRLPDGRQVEVNLDQSFKLVGQEPDEDRPGETDGR